MFESRKRHHYNQARSWLIGCPPEVGYLGLPKSFDGARMPTTRAISLCEYRESWLIVLATKHLNLWHCESKLKVPTNGFRPKASPGSLVRE